MVGVAGVIRRGDHEQPQNTGAQRRRTGSPVLLCIWLGLWFVGCGKPASSDGPKAALSSSTKVAADAVPVPVRKARDRSRDHHPLFQRKTVVDIHINLDATARASLARQPREYTRGTVEVFGKRLMEVGVRLKGHRSFRELGDRPSFILDFKRFSPKRRLVGLRKLVLNGMVEDPTMVREVLGYDLFRRAGVAVPHVGYVRLRVNGGEPQLYLAVEPVDKDFLAHAYSHGKGNLYEGEYGCDVNPGDVWGFDLDAGRDTSRADLKALAALMPRGVTAIFGDTPGAMDRDRVLAFLAMSVVIGDFDGYEHHHNFFLYHEPLSNRWSLMPWGIDRTFFDELKPYSSEGLIARLCFADRTCRLAYVRKLQEALAIMKAADLPTRVSEIDALIGETVEAETKLPYDEARRRKKRKQMMAFIANRSQKLAPWTGCLRGGVELDQDHDGYGCMDCNDKDASIHPGAKEHCDEIDNDCSGLTDDSPTCPCVKHDTKGAQFELCDLPMPWLQAARYCEAKGMTLARIDTKEESKGLYRTAKRIRRTRWWIGLNDRTTEDVFAWRDKTEVSFTYWKGDEPSDMACGEDCVALAKRGKGKWYDSHCGLHRAFICRGPAPKTSDKAAVKSK